MFAPVATVPVGADVAVEVRGARRGGATGAGTCRETSLSWDQAGRAATTKVGPGA